MLFVGVASRSRRLYPHGCRIYDEIDFLYAFWDAVEIIDFAASAASELFYVKQRSAYRLTSVLLVERRGILPIDVVHVGIDVGSRGGAVVHVIGVLIHI